jgi:MraZ protein
MEAFMLLTGTYERSLDDKLRLPLPRPIREVLGEENQLFLTPGTDGSLSLMPQPAFAQLAEKLAARSAHSIEIDGQGRIRLPAELAQLANLEGDVVLIGVGDRVELWNKSRWDAYRTDILPQYDQLAESALSEKPGAASPAQPMELSPERPQQPR